MKETGRAEQPDQMKTGTSGVKVSRISKYSDHGDKYVVSEKKDGWLKNKKKTLQGVNYTLGSTKKQRRGKIERGGLERVQQQ